MPFPDFFEADRKEVDAALDSLLPAETTAPPVIHRAMRYSVFAGGKRLRPILCLESARIFLDPPARVLPVACALEFIHTYSLIHDDLPALDNDDLRRGRPTCHKQFGDAMAILAGDALLTRAFEVLSRAELPAERCAALIREIATAAGTVNGMVGGQVADLEAEGKPIDPKMLEYIHRSKTAALIRVSVVSGAIAGGAVAADVERLRSFGENIGLAFQVVDDILDVEESSATLGKTAGKDESQKKATYPALYGLEKSHETARGLLERAHEELAPFSARAQRLRELADFLVARRA
ncbi:MAG TPA: farnesyl diphosphate synthase [Candidatus Acidoferrales bacterium]|nr:farnesyl diphosphate synthase [Candidatus Acidoferrales bacterium]